MLASTGQTWESHDESGFDTASVGAPRRQAPHWAKTAGMAALVATLLLLGFVAGRATAGGSTTSEIQQQMVQQKEIVKIRKPVVEGQCTASGGECSASKCCQTTNFYCWQKNPNEAYCKETCPAGWKCTELEGGDTMVPVAHDSDGTSLFCFSSYIKNRGVDDSDDYTLDLLLTQLKVKTGIFACDEWRVFSDIKTGLNNDGSLQTIQVSPAPGDDFHQSRRKDVGGWGGGQYINTPFYRQVWNKLSAEKDDPALAAKSYYTKSWLVKSDPDVVFIAARLQQKLAAIQTPKEGVYLEHCKEVNYGFFGSLEVMSKTAAKILFDNVERCYNGEVNWKDSKMAQKYGWYGEDLFAQKCMDRHGVKKVWDFSLVTDGTCKASRPDGQKENMKWVPDPETCRTAGTPAYKPLKMSNAYFACLSSMTQQQYNFCGPNNDQPCQ
jgi:hypothetical protein